MPSAGSEVRHFRYADLAAATGGFAPSSRLGAGGFGEVFRGTLPDGTAVAVKRVRDSVARRSHQLEVVGELVREAQLMDTAARGAAAAGCPHLVPLLGVCLDGAAQLCLVMPLMASGSLADHIGRPWGVMTTGRLRASAALHAARGVAALHAQRPRLLHRDVKPENVLLDGELRAYVADYGIGRVVSGEDTQGVYSGEMYGTMGYLAPETRESCRYSIKVGA